MITKAYCPVCGHYIESAALPLHTSLQHPWPPCDLSQTPEGQAPLVEEPDPYPGPLRQ